MNTEQIAPVRLTLESVSPKLEIGRKSMAGDTGTLETNASLEKARVHAAEAARVAKEALAKERARQQEEDQRRYTSEQDKKKEKEEKEFIVAPNQAELITAWEKYIKQNTVKGSEARKQAEELAQRLIKQGKMPDTLTSKGEADATAGQVVENALLDENSLSRASEFKKLLDKDKLTKDEEEDILQSHKERLSKAQQLLERTLTKKQKLAFLKAHYVGLGEKGKDGGKAGAYNLTPKQILERARLLSKAGFSEDERRWLIETGLAAVPVAGGVNYNTQKNDEIAAFLLLPVPPNPTLQEIRLRIEQQQNAAIAAGRPGISHSDFMGYMNQFTTLTKEQTSTLDITEYNNFRRSLHKIGHLAEMAEDIETDPRRTFFEAIGKDLMDRMDEHKPTGTAPDAALYAQEQAQFKAELERFVIEFNPFQGNLSDETAKLLVDFAAQAEPDDKFAYESIEKLGLKVIAAPLGAETGDYQLGFYAQINFDALLTALKSKSDLETGPNKGRLVEQLNVLTDLEESLRLFHEMNRFTLRGEFEDAAKFATSILPKYSEVLQKRKGVAAIQRLLETAHSVTLSKDRYINEDNDQEMMGAKVNKVTGRFDADQTGSVLASFRRQIEFYRANSGNAALMATLPADIRQFIDMEDWEIGLAFSTARNIFNIQQRKAEWVAQGQIPAGARAWESIPQESAAKLYNAGRWLWDRFKMGENRGGQVWFKRLMDAMERNKETEGWGHTDIEKIRDDDIQQFELPTLTGIRAWWASWRATGGILRQTPIGFPGGALAGATIEHMQAGSNKTLITPDNASLGLLLNTGAIVVNGRKWSELSDHEHADYFRSVLLRPDGQLRDDFQSSLGVVYKVALTPSGGHHRHENHELNRVKEQIRTKIWERVALENPLIAISYMHGLKLKGRNAILADVYNTPGVNWREFQEKMNFYHELKMAKVRGKKNPTGGPPLEAPIPTFTLQQAIDLVHNNAPGGTYELTAQEQALLADVRAKMHEIAPHMANVKYAFVPFMNDALFEQFDYEQPGREAYARHYRDLGQFATSNNAISGQLDNLGKIHDYEKMIEFMDEFTKGITAVHGDEYAKEKAYAVAEATIAFFRRGEDVQGKKFKGENELSFSQKLHRTFKQTDPYHSILQLAHKPNSEAQKAFNSVHVLALDRQQVYDAMHHWLAAGVLGETEEDELKKRFGGGVFKFIIKMLLEQAFRFGALAGAGAVVGFAKGFGKEALDTEKVLKDT